jgi:multidrug efflux pump subunit AcrA (membrane-fusion protein)
MKFGPRTGNAASSIGRHCRRGVLLVAILGASGCGHDEKSDYSSSLKPQTVQLIHPEIRTIVRVVGQPSFIEAYERTSIYPKMTAYIDKWIVDIGDKVKKGDVLARLFVPEIVEDFGTKKATVKLDEERIELAQTMVEVAEADVQAAQARLEETQSILGKYQAEVDRWESEVDRLDLQVKRGVVDAQILLESQKQLKSSAAQRDAARSAIKRAAADLLSSRATLANSKVNVSVARADLGVAISEAKRLEAWVGYLTLTAPFEGIIVARNANTFDFVLPASGDPSADRRAPDLSPSGTSAPIYVVDRTDVVRVFVDIPEQDANYVHIGSKASVLARSFRDSPIEGTVTRTSWALNVKSRTLRAEVDLPNTETQLLPGMYAYAKVVIDRPGVYALPLAAITQGGDKTYCWIGRNGHAERIEIRTGISDGDWIEVTSFRPATSVVDASWAKISGTEEIISGDLSILAEGSPIEVDPPSNGAKVAIRPTSTGSQPTSTPR